MRAALDHRQTGVNRPGDPTVNRAAAILALCLAASAPAWGNGLGRFFLTPAQRATLDSLKQQSATETSSQDDTGSVTLNGVVKRSDGQTTIWLNDKPLPASARRPARNGEGPAGDPVQVMGREQSGAYIFKLPYAQRNIRLKVGQRLDPGTGTVEEPFQERRLSEPKASGINTPGAEAAMPRDQSPVAPVPGATEAGAP